MKLLYCPFCADVVRLSPQSWRMCECGESGGQYNKDNNTATIGGKYTRVFGLANPFFEQMWLYVPDDKRIEFRRDHNYGPGDVWWGGFPGDTQLFRIDDPEGPRLKIRIVKRDIATNVITIIDKRPYTIDGKALKTVIVPSNVRPSFKGKAKK